jgi:hypothetical protein
MLLTPPPLLATDALLPIRIVAIIAFITVIGALIPIDVTPVLLYLIVTS